jgi:O-antigen ligase
MTHFAQANLSSSAHSNKPTATWRQQLPATILSTLPLTLYFQVGLMYAGFFLFLLTWLASGEWAEKWQRMRQHPLLAPVFALSLITLLIALVQTRAEDFWSAFAHYQIYWLLLPMLSIGAGAWQERALKNLLLGALICATLFYAQSTVGLPNSSFFRSYVLYEGNKSILLGLLLALSAGVMLFDWRRARNCSAWHHAWRAVSLMYVLGALVFCSKSRTALLMFMLCALLCLAWQMRWTLLRKILMFCAIVATFVGIVALAKSPAPVTCSTIKMREVHHMHGGQVVLNRAICTLHQLQQFKQGQTLDEDGMRLEIYAITSQMAFEKPWLGWGMGQWISEYAQRASGKMSEKMTTPHNDYLLYWVELGVFGLLGLIGLYAQQLKTARRMAKQQQPYALLLAMITLSMMMAACFNAILRDTLFGLAFLIVLAIPLAGLKKNAVKNAQTQ